MVIFRTGLGVGDVLLATGVLKAWVRQNHEKVFVETIYPDLYSNSPWVRGLWTEGKKDNLFRSLFAHRGVWRVGNYVCKVLNHYTIKPTYPFPCRGKHLMDAMAECIGVTLHPEERRPFIYLTENEISAQSWAKGCIVVQSSSTNYWTVNKHWVPGRMQVVVDQLVQNGLNIIHLGSTDDESLQSVRDLRGKTTLREAAAILANALLLIGLEGGLMHLARAVDARAIVIYTGYTLPQETGYPENINLRDPGAGEGCWRREYCEHCTRSAETISVGMVLEAFERVNSDNLIYESIFDY
jgi:ADP-heptose:LPS heptosyltransferase